MPAIEITGIAMSEIGITATGIGMVETVSIGMVETGIGTEVLATETGEMPETETETGSLEKETCGIGNPEIGSPETGKDAKCPLCVTFPCESAL